MRNIFAVRIVRFEYKFLYVFAAAAIGLALNYGLIAVGLPRVIGIAIAPVFSLAVYLYGARVFRGPNEALEPARPWWKMTADKRLSVLFGILFVLMSIVYAGVVLIAATHSAGAAEVGPFVATGLVLESDIAIFALFAILAFFYVNSAARLPRAAKVTAEPAS
jgi:hypothetical protein